MNIVIVGIGGQGTILASRVLSDVLIKQGYDVKKSEVHGMSQRGGTVISHIRYSEKKVYSPLIRLKGADIMLSFHPNETRRYKHLLKENAFIIELTEKDREHLPHPKTLNVYGLGVLAKKFPFPEEVWLQSLEENVKPKLLEVNKQAFMLGIR